jgi:hypothetical protein
LVGRKTAKSSSLLESLTSIKPNERKHFLAWPSLSYSKRKEAKALEYWGKVFEKYPMKKEKVIYWFVKERILEFVSEMNTSN